MIGCVLATVGVIGLLKMAHYRRHAYGYCGGGWGRRSFLHHRFARRRHGGFGPSWDDGDVGPEWADEPGVPRGGGWGRRFILNGVLDRLEATPAQERAITAAVEEFRAEAAKFRGELRQSRTDIAGAFRKPQFDEVALGELYARHDTAIEGLRRAFVGLGAKVHDALEEKQRARLADLIEAGPRFWRGGLFRSGWGRGAFDRHPWD
ncbi:MAG TPA: periplasmic heavy metal sensor [Polyangia bacterium]|jgi:hypothetical protein|nr:periplasmic heavy metal sensor [Polyangia bacterium]